MSYCAVHNLNDTNGRGCVECIRDERDAARAEAARLRDVAQALIDYETEGAPEFYYWEEKFDALKAALEER